jgi:hypothetical protein
MADANEETTTDTTKADSKSEDLIPRSEAQKAFKARDEAKAALRALEDSGRVVTPEQFEKFRKLEEAAAKADEDRKRKAGEFDSLRTQLIEKHTTEIKERDSKLSQLSERFKSTVVRAEFGSAVDYFSGSESSKTILDVDLGMAALGKYVQVEDTDDDIGYRVVVKSPKGDTILGADGNPASFTEAIGELIKLLPNRDRILRGSGKTGSGSSGGSTVAGKSADLAELTRRAERGDKEAIAALRARRNAGSGVVMGSAFTR